MLEFRLEGIQYPHRRRCNGWGCRHDETRPVILCEHVVCFAHTLHLVVADVYYEKLLPLVTAIEDPYSEEDEGNHADDGAPDLTLPQQLS